MPDKATSPPAEARDVLGVARELFADALLAVYLHGSAVSGGLRPTSDVDLLVVTAQPLPEAMREHLLAALMRISGRHPAPPGGPRCVELMVFLKPGLSPPAYPAMAEFVYGEWLRDRFEAGERPRPAPDPELTLVLAQARREARPLFGPAAADLLPPIPDDDVRRAMRDLLPSLRGNLAGDERNVLLTLARMWRTATTGDFVTKDVAADWAIPRLPEPIAATLAGARNAYLGGSADACHHRPSEARAAEYLHRQVAAVLL